MKSRLFLALLAMVAVVGVRSLSAEDAAAKIMCPVSGHECGKDHAADYEGGKVYFCCEKCPAAFAKDTEKFAAKARHQMVLTGQLEQVHCPLTHKDMKAETAIDVCGTKIAFCCNNCKGAVEKMAADDQIAKCFAKADCFKIKK